MNAKWLLLAALAALAAAAPGAELSEAEVSPRAGADREAVPREAAVLAGLHRAAEAGAAASQHGAKSAAVLFGACVDGIAEGVPVLERVGAAAPAAPAHHSAISSAAELAEVFAFFFEQGAAAERYVADEALFAALVEAVRADPAAVWRFGGNAGVMAKRLAAEGARDVLLSAAQSDAMREHMPGNVRVLGPESGGDDVHIILEYAKGATFGAFTAPRANRFALHSDKANAEILSLESFREARDAGALPDDLALVVVGGLHLMQDFAFGEEGVRGARLREVKDEILALRAAGLKVHFELASVSELPFLQELYDNVLKHATSVGCNEQELGILHDFLAFGNMSVVHDSHPRVANTVHQAQRVFRHLRGHGKGGLQRLHVHTLAHQLVLAHQSSDALTAAAAAKAALAASAYVCGADAADPQSMRHTDYDVLLDSSFMSKLEGGRRMPIVDDEPVTCWTEDAHDIDVCVAVQLVCKAPVQTIGGGDNISAAGLGCHMRFLIQHLGERSAGPAPPPTPAPSPASTPAPPPTPARAPSSLARPTRRPACAARAPPCGPPRAR